MFYSELPGKVKPKVECRLKAGSYTMNRTSDMTVWRFFPLEGHNQVLTLKLVSYKKGSRIKKVSACLISEFKITRDNKRLLD